MATSDQYCILGAGSSGLTVAKNFAQRGIACQVIEREDDVGGNWYYGKPASSVYQSTHLISSCRMTEYTDFHMPRDLPDYPGHRQVWEYLRSYARHFGLYERVEFGRSVERIEPVGGQIAGDSPAAGPEGNAPAIADASSPAWNVTLDGGETRRYRGVVIANGHLWDPKYPNYPGRFDGLILHSHDYKTPDVLRGRRVLVVGAGNSGCDIAVESAQNAARTLHSMRRGYHYLPKYCLGMPADVLGEMLLRWRVPLALRRMLAGGLAKLILGWPQDYGLKKPDHRLFETHPIVNSQMLYYVGHGDITVKPDVAELEGEQVRFVDGSREPIDVIVYATGYHISFPFIDKAHLNWNHDAPRLYLHVFHPRYDNLFVAGMIQPDSGQFGLVDWQAQAIAAFIVAQSRHPRAANRLRRLKANDRPDLGRGIRYVDSTRHRLEVEHFGYRRRLKRLVAMLG